MPASHTARLKARFSMLFRKSESSLSVAKTGGRAAPETQAPDYACRVADHAALMSDELREYVRGAGFRIIGYRALYDAMNGS